MIKEFPAALTSMSVSSSIMCVSCLIISVWCTFASCVRARLSPAIPPGVSLNVEVIGSNPTSIVRAGVIDSRLIIIIPGNPGQALFYATIARALSIYARARVVVLSLAGHCAVANGGGYHDLAAQRAHVLSCVRQLVAAAPTGATVTLIGHSIGGWLALDLLRESDLRAARVVLWMPTLAHIAASRDGVRLSPLLHYGRAATGVAAAVLGAAPRWLQRFIAGRFVPSVGASSHSLADAILSLFSTRVAVNALFLAADELRVLHEPDFVHGAAVASRVAAIFAPGDPWNDHAGADAAAAERLLPGACIVVEGGLSHSFVLNAGQVDKVAKITAQFIDEAATRDGMLSLLRIFYAKHGEEAPTQVATLLKISTLTTNLKSPSAPKTPLAATDTQELTRILFDNVVEGKWGDWREAAAAAGGGAKAGRVKSLLLPAQAKAGRAPAMPRASSAGASAASRAASPVAGAPLKQQLKSTKNAKIQRE